MELSPNPYNNLLHPCICNAYNSCLELERCDSWTVYEEDADDFQISPVTKLSPKVVARCLGQTLLNMPSENGRNSLANDINSCNSPGKLASLTLLVIEGMVRLFYNPKGLGQVELQKHSPRPSLTFQAGRITKKAMKDPEARNVKTLVQARDNYRCIISKDVDTQTTIAGLTSWDDEEPSSETYLSHILDPFNIKSIGDSEYSDGPIKGNEKIKEWASAAATIVKAEIALVELHRAHIHRAENSFISSITVHAHFDSLRVALSPVPNAELPHTYRVHTYPPNRHRSYRVPTEIVLVDHSGGQVPMPNPRYFELHSICAKFMHLSGASKVAEKLLRNLE
ncbi:hypothetical protein BDP27DRAFT_1254190 [Rhodocollybia butyracea]|uniref:Uncharacterized protein n=1 Tax=Rhodocollybia butyracea TaxID=206335 RepID=A0A9P5Q9A0_9AGAR|nr:hypothetical protein BDP27DRAFT_1254190 [Rhodocollybia butyracea]